MITVAFDSGTSGSKVLVCYESPEYPFEIVERYYLIAPAVRKLTRATYEAQLIDLELYHGGVGAGLLSYQDPDTGEQVYWEVGESATRPGLLLVAERKFESCLVKVLSFLGYLIAVELATKEPMQLNLGVLLPFDEFGNRRLLAQWLRQTIPEFEFNGKTINTIEVASMDCKPEGYGIYKANGGDQVAIVIVGHSDSSCLYFNQGGLDLKRSCTLPETGMHDFIHSLDFPITYELRTAQLLSQAGSNVKAKALLALTQTHREAELTQLQSAIATVKAQYWTERAKQLRALSFHDREAVYISGGTANYFAQELNQLFRELFAVRLRWSKQLMLGFYQRYGLTRKTDLLHRFADCYGYFGTLPSAVPMQLTPVEVV